MARGDLIAPVRAAEAGRRRRAAGFAVLSGALLAVLGSVLAAVRGGEHSRPGALAPSGASAMGAVHEAQSAAQGAVQNVATFLAALKAQKVEHAHTRTHTRSRARTRARTHTLTHTHAHTHTNCIRALGAHLMNTHNAQAAPKRSDAHALDWNWAPELQRNKNIRNWVGSDWVKPLVGDREIKQIAPPKFGAAQDRLAAAKTSEGLAIRVTSGSPAARLPPMPSLRPLHYFSSGKAANNDWNTRCCATRAARGRLPCSCSQSFQVRGLTRACGALSRDAIKLAKHSVDFVQKSVRAGARTPKAAPKAAPPR